MGPRNWTQVLLPIISCFWNINFGWLNQNYIFVRLKPISLQKKCFFSAPQKNKNTRKVIIFTTFYHISLLLLIRSLEKKFTIIYMFIDNYVLIFFYFSPCLKVWINFPHPTFRHPIFLYDFLVYIKFIELYGELKFFLVIINMPPLGI